MPAVVMGPLARDRTRLWRDWAAARDALFVDAADVRGYEKLAASELRPVADARVPLENAENARIVAWRPADGGKEHLAIVIGEIDPTAPVLVRLHSECFTGDLLASLRCDCGEQLRGAIAEIARHGVGRAALSGAGRPRHRAGQQAARLPAAGRRLRHGRRQRAARVRSRRAALLAGGHDAAPDGHRPDPADDQQSREDRASSRPTASRWSSACGTSSRPTATTRNTCAPRPRRAGICSERWGRVTSGRASPPDDAPSARFCWCESDQSRL